MKQFLLLTILFLITSCGGSKKAIENTEVKKADSEVEIKKNLDFMIKEDIAVEDLNPNFIMSDSVTITKTEGVIPHKIDSLDFNQNLKKREGYIHDIFDELLEKYVSENGNVDYKGFKNSHERLRGYISTLQMMYPKIDDLNREEKLAYWINAYNALTIDLILRNQPIKSIKDIDKPWDQRLWKFGDKWLNLNHIEHNILRKMDEPRIHFAIVCASYSCPKLLNTAFTAKDLDTQLTLVTKEFLADKSKNNISQNNLKLSKIFKWFAKDFKTNGSIIDFLNKYTEIKISPKAKKSFKDYNWDLND